MSLKIIGKCSRCGGNVQAVDGPWFGTPPPPTCQSCGAVKKGATPVIDMEPRKSDDPENASWRPYSRRMLGGIGVVHICRECNIADCQHIGARRAEGDK